MTSKQTRFAIAAITLVAAACTGGAAGNPTSQPVTVPTVAATIAPIATTATATPNPTPEPSASQAAVGGPKPTPGAIDPCTLLTTEEASKLMGKTLSAGVSLTLDPDRVCTWKSGLTEVKLFLAPPAPDLATAEAYWDTERAQVPAEVSVTDLTLWDRSAYASGALPGGAGSLSALFVIDGTQFFDLYCGFPACSQDASVAAAQLITGRLP